MAEAPRLEARRRAGFDDATVLWTVLVDRARITSGDGHVETAAAFAAVLHEAETGGLRLELGIELEETLAHALLVALEEMHGARTMMTAAAARDAVAPVGVGLSVDAIERHRRGL